MPLADLKDLSVRNPDKYNQLVASLAERRCVSLQIEGLTVSKDKMTAALHKALADLGIFAVA